MHKTLLKSLVRLIRNSMSRFLAVAAIVSIGVAFFTGVRGSSEIMAVSVDRYSDEMKLKDLTLYSNYGFDEKDVQAVAKQPEVRCAEGAKFTDAIVSYGNAVLVTRIHSIAHSGRINQFVLAEGRLPENEHEALGEKGSDLTGGFVCGTRVEVSMPDGSKNENLKSDYFIITGIIDTPVYLNEVKENSTLSNQLIHTYLYINESAFDMDYYTEMNVLTEKGESFNSFGEPYADYCADVRENLRTFALTRQNARRDQLKEDALAEYRKGMEAYEEGLAEYEEKITEGEAKLADAEAEIQKGEEELAAGVEQLNEGIAQYDAQSAEAYRQLAAALAMLNDSKLQLEEKEAGFERTKADLYANIDALRAGIEKLKDAKAGLTAIDEGLAEIAEQKEKLNDEKLALLISILEHLDPETPLEDVEEALQRLSEAADQFKEIFGPLAELNLKEIQENLQNAEQQVRDDYDYLGSEETLQTIEKLKTADPEILISEYEEEIPGQLSECAKRYNPFTETEDIGTLLSAYENAHAFTEAAVSFLDSDLYTQFHDIVMEADPESTVDALIRFDPAQFSDLIEALQEQSETEIHTVGGLLDAYHDLVSRLDELEEQLINTRADIAGALEEQGISENEIDTKIAEYEDLIETILAGIADGERQLRDARSQLSAGYDTYYASESETNILLAEARRKIAEGQREIALNTGKLADAKAQLKEGYEELAKAKADSLEELEDARKKLEDAKKQIDDMAEGSWTVLDRKSHYASATYHETVDQMRAIGDIFPLFFILVAALVCLTTMSRMVSEQRSETGTLRALGYTRLQCAAKYLVYAASATLIGCIIGSILGLESFPRIIYNAWKMMYILPPIVLEIPWKLVLMTAAMFLGAMVLTAWLVIRSDMREVPASLMRPKVISSGRSTFLEKIGLIWNHLTFTWKVTMRNIFRYRRRFIMTVLGVAGCAALMVTGFGIRDSINNMVSLQFDEILQFDGTASLAKDTGDLAAAALKNRLLAREDIEAIDETAVYSAKARDEHEEGLDHTVTVEIFAKPEDVENAYVLRERKTHKPISLNDNGIVISERLAENLHLKKGDTFLMEDAQGNFRSFYVNDICELYIYHYAFMTEAYYENLCGEKCEDKAFFIHIKGDEDVSAKLQQDLLEETEIASISFYDGILSNFSTMVKSLDLIVWTLIFSSMALAFVVLGNLININVSERQREIATLKVLGFRRKEVQSYIFKENNILTIIGALAGLPLGALLHHYIISCIEMEFVIFGRSLNPFSCIVASLLTVIFGMIVNRANAKHLDAIAMVESLKSVE